MKSKLRLACLALFLLITSSCNDGIKPVTTLSPSETDTTCGNLAPTLSFHDEQIQGGGSLPVAWQSGLPVPSFDPQNRERIDLGGAWKKQRVNLDACLSLTPRNSAGIGLIEEESEGRQLPDYDDSSWVNKDLPMVENEMPEMAGDPKGPEIYEGGVWYRRHVDIPAEWHSHLVTINFLGANYIVDVWVNGEWIGYHEGGYTPFLLDISKALLPGQDNIIAIRVDNPAWGSRLDTVPAIKSDWWNYTGIIQDIYLEKIPELWVVRTDVSTPDLSGQVKVKVVLHNTRNKSIKGDLTLQVRDTDPSLQSWVDDPRAQSISTEVVSDSYAVQVKIKPNQVIVVETVLEISDPVAWEPGNPHLYVLEANIETRQESDLAAFQFGIRTIQTQDTQLLLNNAPLFLAGIARHEEWPDSGRTASWEKIQADLILIQSLGANYVRTAHYPNHIYTYIIADRLGLATGVEIPLWQYTAVEFAAQEKRQIADQMWREMILSGSNRPSILLWSTNNEAAYSSQRIDFISRVVTDFKEYYFDGRLVTQSAAADRGGPSDASQALVDVPGWTMYFGIFHGSTYYEGTSDFLQQAHLAYPNQPIFNTEYGIWSSGGGSDLARQTEVFQETYRALTEVTQLDPQGNINSNGYLAGIVWWAAFDWYTVHTNLQTMGLFSMDRLNAKPVAVELKNAYQDLRASQSR